MTFDFKAKRLVEPAARGGQPGARPHRDPLSPCAAHGLAMLAWTRVARSSLRIGGLRHRWQQDSASHSRLKLGRWAKVRCSRAERERPVEIVPRVLDLPGDQLGAARRVHHPHCAPPQSALTRLPASTPRLSRFAPGGSLNASSAPGFFPECRVRHPRQHRRIF